MNARPHDVLVASLSLFAVLGLLAYSCAVNPVTGRSELALVSFSEEEEVALGARAYTPAVQQQGGFYRDQALEDYVQGVGTRIARVSHRSNLNYRYRVLNSSVPNAFALPGGYIVINRGLLVHLSSEAELAAVLGHETGHVTARHSLAGYQRAMAANLLLAGVSVAAGGKTGVMQLSGVTASLVENGFSRDQEREADWLGIDYMVKAGYNPEGAVRLQEYFYKQLEGGNPIGRFFFRCLTRRAVPSGRPSCFGGRIDLPDINDPATPPAAASGGLSPSVYSPRDVVQPENHKVMRVRPPPPAPSVRCRPTNAGLIPSSPRHSAGWAGGGALRFSTRHRKGSKSHAGFTTGSTRKGNNGTRIGSTGFSIFARDGTNSGST